MSHGSKERLNLIQKEETVWGWFKKLCHQFSGRRIHPASLNLSANRHTMRAGECRSSTALLPTPLRTFVWTREEAEAAWTAKRTEVNLALMLPNNTESIQSCTGGFMVDGRLASVEVCVNEAVKQWILTTRSEERRATEREQDTFERQKWAKFCPNPERIEGRTCCLCGGKLVLIILNYHYEHGTDVISPADKAEKCLSCGRVTVLVSPGPERLF
jgi:hypothetical protein